MSQTARFPMCSGTKCIVDVGGCMKRSYLLLTVISLFAATLISPLSASAFQITGGGGTQTLNPYGLWFAGQEACAQEGCHSAISAKETPHSNMVTDVQMFPSKLFPAAGDTSFWPYTGPFGGLTLRPRDMYLQVGDLQFGFLEYIGANPSSLATNVVPSDDIYVWSPMEYLIEEGVWADPTTPISYSSYSQSCSGCHNLGVTRPSNAKYTLANGGTQTTTTPSSVSGFSIQCEVCHGSGKTPDGHKKGVPTVVGGKQILKAQVCGQCHVGGTTPQKNAKGTAFGNPNGYTTDTTLSAYLTPFTTVESETTFMNYINNGGTKPKFLPNGADYSMRHSYYNEWLVNKVPSGYGGEKGHADPFNNAVQAYANPKCLKCHSGLGFLNRIGAIGPSGKKIVGTFPTISEAATSDPGISCQVCHTGHVGYKEHGYDSLRRWANGRTVGCGDCHNWQFEMLDQAIQYETVAGEEYARPAVDSRTRHPQREMYTGGEGGEYGIGGMWGVAPVGEFMPGVECIDCHMPRTHREGMPANDDGNKEATRMSHRFHIVEPGEAARWKLRPNGDSCVASCHEKDAADFTRTEMQTWIDQQRSLVQTASDETTAALQNAASDLGLAAWTDFLSARPATGPASALPAATWKMLQRSAQNADFVISDGSRGIHNPTYALAGLAKAKTWANSADAALSAKIAPGPVNGVGVEIVGSLFGGSGDAIPGAQVVLEMSADGGTTWSAVATATPNAATGAFSANTGLIVGSRMYRCSFTPSEGVVFLSDVLPVTVPVTTAAFLPVTAPDGWMNASLVTVTMNATPGSLTMYTLSGATTAAQSVYTGPISITAEGATTITYWSTDADGTEFANTALVRLDRGAPTVSTDAVAEYLNTSKVRVWGTDTGAGISKLQYALDGAAMTTAGGTWASVSTSKLGKHSLLVRVTDGAGKVTSRTLSYRVRNQPSLTRSPSGSAYTVGKGKSLVFKGTLHTSSGAHIGSKSIKLQKSSNGTSWSTYTTLTSNSSGAVSFTLKPSSKGTVYWRWYSAENDFYRAAASSKMRIVTP